MTAGTHLVTVERVVKEFRLSGGFRGGNQIVHAVSDVSFHIDEGETLAMVGESGCGKSTIGRLMLRLAEPTSGTVRLEGRDLGALDKTQMREARGAMQIIFQDPYASLNPRMNVYRIISEPLIAHKMYNTRAETENRFWNGWDSWIRWIPIRRSFPAASSSGWP